MSHDCISLLSIAMSSSVTKNKEKSAFSEYSRLRNVVRSKAVQSISKSAFADCVGKIRKQETVIFAFFCPGQKKRYKMSLDKLLWDFLKTKELLVSVYHNPIYSLSSPHFL